MLRLQFNLVNPWSDRFDPGHAWSNKLTKTKAWEAQAYRSNTLIEFCLQFTHRQDHAGLQVEFGIFSFSFIFNIYDTRHWNYSKKQWEVYDD